MLSAEPVLHGTGDKYGLCLPIELHLVFGATSGGTRLPSEAAYTSLSKLNSPSALTSPRDLESYGLSGLIWIASISKARKMKKSQSKRNGVYMNK